MPVPGTRLLWQPDPTNRPYGPQVTLGIMAGTGRKNNNRSGTMPGPPRWEMVSRRENREPREIRMEKRGARRQKNSRAPGRTGGGLG